MLYKILSRDGHSINGGDLQWSLPHKDGRKWIPGGWHEVEGELRPCESGLHLAINPWNTWYRWGARVFSAEHKGERIDHGDKIVCRKARLLRELRYPRWLLEAGHFVASIADIPYYRPDGKPLKRWRLFTAPTLAAAGAAAGDAARDAAGDAAGDAARDAALAAARAAARAAAGDAARAAARAAALAAARDAARDAAGDAARDAAGDAARAAAGDAALLAQCLIVADRIDPEHLNHANDRMRAWRKGYCLLCDVAGVLYVYAAAETREEA